MLLKQLGVLLLMGLGLLPYVGIVLLLQGLLLLPLQLLRAPRWYTGDGGGGRRWGMTVLRKQTTVNT